MFRLKINYTGQTLNHPEIVIVIGIIILVVVDGGELEFHTFWISLFVLMNLGIMYFLKFYFFVIVYIKY